MKSFQPMRPCDAYEDDIKYPLIAQPKIDGVYSGNRDGVLKTRMLKPHANLFTTQRFSLSQFHGLCGEKIIGFDPTAKELCNRTSSLLSTNKGEPELSWWFFDYITDDFVDQPYVARYEYLQKLVQKLKVQYPDLAHLLFIVPNKWIYNQKELLEFEEECLNAGYEGIIIRDPHQKYKYGRCGKSHMGAWRIKRFIDAEILVTKIVEGNQNNNEALLDELGYTKRSSAQDNLVPNGMVGSIIGTLLDDIFDKNDGSLLVRKGEEVIVAPGEMKHPERKMYWENQHKIIGKIAKFKLFPKGIKDKPRFPQFISLRDDYMKK